MDVELGAAVGQPTVGSGVPYGELLIRFAEAVVRDAADVAALRTELLDRVGPDATGHAAATITAFSGLVRVADGTGIPIDDGLATASAEIRKELDLHAYGGAANSDVDHLDPGEFSSIEALFDNR